MAEHKAYTCDAEGCGAHIMLDPERPSDLVTSHGWYQVLTPGRLPTLHCCSRACAANAIAGQHVPARR